jgi:hypothetical protein
MIMDLFKICCLTFLGFSSISHFSGGSQVNAVNGPNIAIKSINKICTAVIERGIPQIVCINRLGKTAKSSHPSAGRYERIFFFIF